MKGACMRRMVVLWSGVHHPSFSYASLVLYSSDVSNSGLIGEQSACVVRSMQVWGCTVTRLCLYMLCLY
jgi:hypothetical protein